MNKTLKIVTDELKDDKQVIHFEGDFDKAGFSEVKDEVTELVNEFKGEELTFDFAKLKFINSEGIGFLMEAHTKLSDNGKNFVISKPNAHVKDVFKTVGLTDIVTVKS